MEPVGHRPGEHHFAGGRREVPLAVAYSSPRFPEFQFSAGGRKASTTGASTGGR